MNKINSLIISILLAALGGVVLITSNNHTIKKAVNTAIQNINNQDSGGPEEEIHPLSIQSLRNGEYPGSDIAIEQTLDPASNCQRYIASYKSEGLKIYGLLTVPNGQAPVAGWAAIIFNHGYIPPAQYRTTERYIAYTDGFSRAGYV